MLSKSFPTVRLQHVQAQFPKKIAILTGVFNRDPFSINFGFISQSFWFSWRGFVPENHAVKNVEIDVGLCGGIENPFVSLQKFEPRPHPQTRRSPHRSDRKRPSHLGGGAQLAVHTTIVSPLTRWPTTAQSWAICRNRLDRSPTQKGAYIPRTHAQPTMSPRCHWHRNRRKMERRTRQFCQAPRTRESPTSTPPPPTLGGSCPHQPMDCLVDPCCLASLCCQPPRPGLHPPYQCWR